MGRDWAEPPLQVTGEPVALVVEHRLVLVVPEENPAVPVLDSEDVIPGPE